ncbi:ATP-dependent protease LonB [Chengkuizengella axinellae]|uniref:endopeptidase La n=1 Tax=Chengkuizengella axinellae TaxID=3064388 RepID=A0ABT9IV37_9BACL|nr:ATP-dependent protease LonB [Chengkuizengella sp. 2205SS18-9]MDP5272685.1 ATP-dependent protease LonB [Chengkuizengella sp. 2205SS18-9]
MSFMVVLMIIQGFFAVVIGLYFWNQLRSQQNSKSAVDKESKREMEKLHKLRSIHLTQPLSEKARPVTMEDIIGQKEGLRALKASLCGPNPQHVIIYGPPGVGKTAAARVILEEAKKNIFSPFYKESKFIEIDATIARFDERGIADPLIGSVHDPIYQGAGAMGVAGIPQPKPGAVTKAHGGMLFIDEIGELHSIQMNKLLKVLEDRKVFLESSYYSVDDKNIPQFIHDIFQNGLPADFRLVGATTRTPEEIPPAIRSRCIEVFFKPLLPKETAMIAKNAMKKIGMPYEDKAIEVVSKYATNGREAVNIVQMAAGIATTDQRKKMTSEDIEWVINSSNIQPRPDKKIPKQPKVGLVNGLAVFGPNIGCLLEIEATAILAKIPGKGKFTITGVVDEEEMGGGGKKIRRKSMVKSSLENVLTVLRQVGINADDYDIHINFPGGIPMDGPSAGVTIATAIASAVNNIPVDNKIAMTGEVSIHGKVKPVGGVVAKVEAAIQAGAKKVFIPKENWQDTFFTIKEVEVIPMETIEQVLKYAIGIEANNSTKEQDVTSEGMDVKVIPVFQPGSPTLEQ